MGGFKDQSDENEKSDELQLDTAEFAEESDGVLKCSVCHLQFGNEYFDINGIKCCENCKNGAKVIWDAGSPVARFIKAALFGSGAGIAGTAIYLGVLMATGYEIGLISILVGWMVGSAVFVGCERRGGLTYQILAIFITYTAIVSAYVPYYLMEYRGAEASVEESIEVEEPSDGAIALSENSEAIEDGPITSPSESEQVETGEAADNASFTEIVTGAFFLVGFIYSIPFLGGFSNILGLLIIGFALWQAWQMNEKRKLVVSGPYKIGSSDSNL